MTTANPVSPSTAIDQSLYRQHWEQYTSSWKAKTREQKMALFQQALVPDCVYTDPLTQTKGWAALADYMMDFHKQIPGGYFVTDWFLAHHHCSIAKWHMHAEDGTLLGDGISYATYDDQQRLLSMTGFFDS